MIGRTLRLTTAQAVTRALGALFPPVCAGCRAETGTPSTLCPDCWGGLHVLAGPGCRVCGVDIAGLGPGESFTCDQCLKNPPAWTEGRAALVYAATGRRLVLRLKHGDRLDTVPMLAGWMARAGAPLLEAADMVVPVPLHWTRTVRRRFNQSAELARHLTADRPARFRADILVRTRRTPSQEGRSREERRANLAGALAVRPRHRDALAGRRVLLIDDVMTTGATLDAGAGALLDAGAARADVLVLALVPSPSRAYLQRTGDEDEAP